MPTTTPGIYVAAVPKSDLDLLNKFIDFSEMLRNSTNKTVIESLWSQNIEKKFSITTAFDHFKDYFSKLKGLPLSKLNTDNYNVNDIYIYSIINLLYENSTYFRPVLRTMDNIIHFEGKSVDRVNQLKHHEKLLFKMNDLDYFLSYVKHKLKTNKININTINKKNNDTSLLVDLIKEIHANNQENSINNNEKEKEWDKNRIEGYIEIMKRFMYGDSTKEIIDKNIYFKLLRPLEITNPIEAHKILLRLGEITKTTNYNKLRFENETKYFSEFPEKVVKEADDITEKNITIKINNKEDEGRLVFDNLTVYTIDDISTTEIDDGLSIEHDIKSITSNGQISPWIHVHIADPTRLFEPNSVLDLHARLRGILFYFFTFFLLFFIIFILSNNNK